MPLYHKKIYTLSESQNMRIIRNSGCEWMTGNNDIITPEQQKDWWEMEGKYLTSVLFYFDDILSGFGMLRTRDTKTWITLAVLPDLRGKGVGTSIYKVMSDMADDDVWAEIKSNNAASITAASRAGFTVYKQDYDKVIMVKRKNK